MAQGNVWILIESDSKDNPVPVKLKNKWKFTEPILDADTGQQIGIEEIHPSWLGAANRLRQQFGDVREVGIEGKEYILVEMELSFVEGEVEEVQKLQSNRPGNYNFTIYTNSEAIALLRGESMAEVLSLRV
jgi:hypothetical protein